jgi:hypothetical protein
MNALPFLHGAPFEFDITNNTVIPTLFYRVEIVK